MKNKKNAILASATIIATSVIALTTLIASNTQNIIFSKATDQTYNISFNSGKNKFHDYTNRNAYSGDAIIQTDLGNDIGFTYNNLLGGSSTWHILEKDTGDFYNTNPIYGMETLTMSFLTETDFTITWANNSAFENSDSEVYTSSTSSSTVCNFNGDYPAYFKISGASVRLNISSMSISLTCKNYYPTLSISSNDTTMGTVSGDSGVIFSGTNVNILATPNAGYRFVGWYNGDTLISPNASYSFTMGNVDLSYVARFTYESYNLVVESESNNKGTVSNSTGSYEYLSQITIEATPKSGYSFDGWYNGSTLVSNNNPYTFTMPFSNTVYTARFNINSYEVLLTNANPDLGSVTGSGTYAYLSNVNINATPNTGVSFLGWFDTNDNLLSTSKSCSFSMPSENVEFIAKFALAHYSVTLTSNNETMGSVTGGGTYTYNQEVTLIATPSEHHSFVGWYNGETLVSTNATYSFNMPTNNLSYVARFVKNYNLSINSDNENMGVVSGPNECGAGLEVTVIATPNNGYALDRWEDEDFNVMSYDSSYTFVMPEHDVELWAVFDVGYSLVVSSSNILKGTVTGGGAFPANRMVTVTMNQDSGIFKGWYDNNGAFVSALNPYTFSMPSNNYELIATFLTEAQEGDWNASHGIIPTIDTINSTITYGLYPQTRVNDDVLLASLDSLLEPDTNGWYLYGGDYYVKATAKPCSSKYIFQDGTTIVNNATYWFKCEPITWSILNNNNDEYLLLSSVLLDARKYNDYYEGMSGGHYANNYPLSSIRTWLTKTFYNTAFALNNSYIKTTVVNNKAATTDSSSNSYASYNTNDKVFLLSYQDYQTSSYGFDILNNNGRKCVATDWARANTASCASSTYYARYWTRSPAYDYSYSVSIVDNSGSVSGTRGRVDENYNCVRPAITLQYTFD